MSAIMRRLRAKVRDVAFPYRMTAGFPGDITRSHPVSIEPALQDTVAPVAAYGAAVIAGGATAGGGTNTVRALAIGDQALTNVYGIAVRPFPIQAPAGSTNAQQGIGAAVPPGANNPIDVMRVGYCLVQLNVGEVAPSKGAPVYICCEATNGNHVLGGFETTARGAVTQLLLDANRYTYNGPSDANGVVEICIR
jgi:hypothetical protein